MLLLGLIFCAAVSSVLASSGQVVELTDETFESVVGKEKYAVKVRLVGCARAIGRRRATAASAAASRPPAFPWASPYFPRPAAARTSRRRPCRGPPDGRASVH